MQIKYEKERVDKVLPKEGADFVVYGEDNSTNTCGLAYFKAENKAIYYSTGLKEPKTITQARDHLSFVDKIELIWKNSNDVLAEHIIIKIIEHEGELVL